MGPDSWLLGAVQTVSILIPFLLQQPPFGLDEGWGPIPGFRVAVGRPFRVPGATQLPGARCRMPGAGCLIIILWMHQVTSPSRWPEANHKNPTRGNLEGGDVVRFTRRGNGQGPLLFSIRRRRLRAQCASTRNNDGRAMLAVNRLARKSGGCHFNCAARTPSKCHESTAAQRRAPTTLLQNLPVRDSEVPLAILQSSACAVSFLVSASHPLASRF